MEHFRMFISVLARFVCICWIYQNDLLLVRLESSYVCTRDAHVVLAPMDHYTNRAVGDDIISILHCVWNQKSAFNQARGHVLFMHQCDVWREQMLTRCGTEQTRMQIEWWDVICAPCSTCKWWKFLCLRQIFCDRSDSDWWALMSRQEDWKVTRTSWLRQ